MKFTSFILIYIFLYFLTNFTLKSNEYYYADGEKLRLQKVNNEIIVTVDETFNSKDTAVFKSKFCNSFANIQVKYLFNKNFSVNNIKNIKKLEDSLILNEEIININYYYNIIGNFKDTLRVGTFNQIVVKFKDNISENQINNILKSYNLKIVKRQKWGLILELPENKNTLNIANQLYEENIFDFATPNFLSAPRLNRYKPNDEFFNRQITLHNTGQTFTDNHSGNNDADIDATEAWNVTLGSSDVTIAVLDDGVTSNHSDLPNSRQVRLNGSNFAAGYWGFNDPNNPSPHGINSHGNACAGVIAATINNSEGIAGVAPKCKIMPIKLPFGGSPPVSVFADAIEFAVDNGADILSNSWSYRFSDPNLHPAIVNAIQYAVDNGSIVLFSAGNTADHSNNDLGYCSFPSNVEIDNVITVGATDRYYKQANYSPSYRPLFPEINSVIDITATSHKAYPWQITGESLEMWSLDTPTNLGVNPWPHTGWLNQPPLSEELPSSGTNYLSYSGRFGGTSHSCPIVAGVAALLLSINPNFSVGEIFDILTESADEVGGYSYNSNGWSEELGHGRVNAFKALMLACPVSYSIDSDFENDEELTLKAEDHIIFESIVPDGAKISTHAGDHLTLKPGFQARNGSEFHAFIDGCNTFSTSKIAIFLQENESHSKINKILVYPNPTKNVLNIKGLDEGSKITIYNIDGKLFYDGIATKKETTIQLNHVPQGMYIIKIQSENIEQTEKFIVK